MARNFLLRCGWSVLVREWLRLQRIRPEVRLGVAAAAGAVVAPFVVFVAPMARLCWLISGRHLPWPLGITAPRPYVVVNPFETLENSFPADIRELVDRHGHTGERDLTDMSPLMDAWARVGQLLNWNLPVGYSKTPPLSPASSR